MKAQLNDSRIDARRIIGAVRLWEESDRLYHSHEGLTNMASKYLKQSQLHWQDALLVIGECGIAAIAEAAKVCPVVWDAIHQIRQERRQFA